MGFISAFFTKSGPGGFFVLAVFVILLVVYTLTLNWIRKGLPVPKADRQGK